MPSIRLLPRSVLMNVSPTAGEVLRRGWSLTQADILLCALPILLFVSIVSLV
jgi:hypothetical protein